jgi:hypothetical protein
MPRNSFKKEGMPRNAKYISILTVNNIARDPPSHPLTVLDTFHPN